MTTKYSISSLCALLGIVVTLVAGTACSNSNSYAELLNDENKAVNRFLADQRVEGSVPADSVFETGKDAPYYQLDEEGNIFMQVIDAGDPDDRAEDGDLVYFRFLASNLNNYTTADEMLWAGNALNLDQVAATSFRYNNYTLQSSYMWGTGLQMPLHYLGFNCEVNIVIKSQYGPTDNMSNVIPYVYNVRYYRSMI